VAEVSKTEFDVVLMDVQMPEMDGLAAAAAIRQLESGSHRHIPIVAMTAHAIKGDRERCLAAGMDDYLSKPIDAGILRQVIARLAPMHAPAEAPGADDAPVPEFLKAFENDWGLFVEVAEVFFLDYPRQLDRLRQSADSGNAAAFRRAAHSLKGMLRNFQAERAAEKASYLEKKGETGDLSDVGPLVEELEQDIKRQEAQLRKLIAREAPAWR
jgi:response regulator RpfG family c-di-GMP phosphodiesterase